MNREIVQAALNVLNAVVSRFAPDPADLELLRRTLGPETAAPPDELARAVIEQYLQESKRTHKAAG